MWLYVIIIAIILGMYFFNDYSPNRNITWTEFQDLAEKGQVDSILVYSNKNEARAFVNDSVAKAHGIQLDSKMSEKSKPYLGFNIPSTEQFEDYIGGLRKVSLFNGTCKYETANDYSYWIWGFGPILLLILFWIFMTRRMGGGAGGGIFNVGKSKAKEFNNKDNKEVTFKDVAGMEREKKEVMEIVDFLKNPKRYTSLGGTIPKGVLLVGPPGTGKTLIAKAVAGEANVPFLSMSGSDFVEMFVGVGASRVRDTFKRAKEKAPCIIFIDEIDAIGRVRSRKHDFGGNDERESTLNQLLTEMDGFDLNSGIIVIAATNRADVLDKALLRSGRFDRQIYIGVPNVKDREQIFKLHLSKIKYDGSVNIEDLALRTSGMSGADIANICNEAVLLSARRNKVAVQHSDFLEAIDRVNNILDKPSRMTKPVTFDNVAGMNKPKNALKEIIDYLNDPDRFTRLGGKIPRGVLLVGPSGSGKTLLAKAVAGEGHVPFFSVSAAEFQGEYMGSGVSRVKELFDDAKQKAPCIIFIDELDAIGDREIRGNSEREITLNQLLAEMDGYSTNDGVIILAATNRIDSVDKALLRPGRFDRKIYVGFPSEQDRVEIFNLYLNKIATDNNVDAEELAKLSSGFSGVEIAKTCNEAALSAAGKGQDAVTQDDLKEAIIVTRKGLENKNSVIGTITFDDVAGMEETKQEVTEIVEFLRNPQKIGALGGRSPRGALLVGPPGTGKTMLARAVAGEANVPFISCSGSEFEEVFVGLGASRVRSLFQEARDKAPCVIFIDEIDAMGRARNNYHTGSTDQTLNQLLTEMDGFDNETGVMVLAATNREDILDPALTRPGRFDRKVHFNLPSMFEREAIFNVHLKKITLDPSVDVNALARQTPGFSGADIANLCNEAAINATRLGRESVITEDFLEAFDKVTMGVERKALIITQKEKFETAVHEAGHATVSWHVENSEPLVKISIVPRGRALGVNLHSNEERIGRTKQAFLDEICTFMGGRAAEEVFLGFVGTGALNDMQQATNLARSMVLYYGMSDKLPNISYYDPQRQMGERPYSEAQARIIDEEIKRIVNEQYQRAKSLMVKYADQHKQIVDELMEKEVIYNADVERIFGKRPWTFRSEEVQRIYEERRAKAIAEAEAKKREEALANAAKQQEDQTEQDGVSNGEQNVDEPSQLDETPPEFNPENIE